MAERRRAASRDSAPQTVAVIGRGKVGRALARELRTAGLSVRVWASRRLPVRPARVEAWILCVRDAALLSTAEQLARVAPASLPPVALHTAGALGPEALAPLASRGVAVAQAHPLASFASQSRSPTLSGAALVVQGDRRAVQSARHLARALGMRFVQGSFDPAAYHAAAALVANGAIGLVAAAARLLEGQALSARPAELYAPLLRSVSEQLAHLGLPDALSGPVRRGDLATLRRHFEVLERDPSTLPLYRGLLLTQLPLAAAIGEASAATLKSIASELGGGAAGRRFGVSPIEAASRGLSPARR